MKNGLRIISPEDLGNEPCLFLSYKIGSVYCD